MKRSDFFKTIGIGCFIPIMPKERLYDEKAIWEYVHKNKCSAYLINSGSLPFGNCMFLYNIIDCSKKQGMVEFEKVKNTNLYRRVKA